ncbi:hypothetical protein ACXPWS_16500 [Mycobacterium sp. BMJ-28]
MQDALDLEPGCLRHAAVDDSRDAFDAVARQFGVAGPRSIGEDPLSIGGPA